MRISEKYRKRLNNYLAWIPKGGLDGIPFKRFTVMPAGMTAEELMMASESGTKWTPTDGRVVDSEKELELLNRYIEGKTSRDWHISEWLNSVKMGYAVAEEFLGTLGMDAEEFRSVFAREPNSRLDYPQIFS